MKKLAKNNLTAKKRENYYLNGPTKIIYIKPFKYMKKYLHLCFWGSLNAAGFTCVSV